MITFLYVLLYVIGIVSTMAILSWAHTQSHLEGFDEGSDITYVVISSLFWPIVLFLFIIFVLPKIIFWGPPEFFIKYFRKRQK